MMRMRGRVAAALVWFLMFFSVSAGAGGRQSVLFDFESGLAGWDVEESDLAHIQVVEVPGDAVFRYQVPETLIFKDVSLDAPGGKCIRLNSADEELVLSRGIGVPDRNKKYRLSVSLRNLGLEENAVYVKIVATLKDGTEEPVSFWYKEAGDLGFPEPRFMKERAIISGGTRDWYRFYTTLRQFPAEMAGCRVEVGLLSNKHVAYGSGTENNDELRWFGTENRAVGDGAAVWLDDVCIEEVGDWPVSVPEPYKGEILVHGEAGLVPYFHGRDADIDLILEGHDTGSRQFYDSEAEQFRYRIIDGWNRVVKEEVITPSSTVDKDTNYKWVHNLRHSGIGYYGLVLYVNLDGTEYELASTSYGILPKAEDDYYEADPDSAFGAWATWRPLVPGAQTLRDIGVKWTQLDGPKCWKHWKYVDGKPEQAFPDYGQKYVDFYKSQNIDIAATFIMKWTPRQFSSAPIEALKKNPKAYWYYPPSDLSDMDEFVEKNFEAYRKYPRAWGANHEPNYIWNWKAGIDELVKFSRHFYKLCKKLDPSCKVIGPNAGSWNVPFVKKYLAAGGADTVDGIDIHYNTNAADPENGGNLVESLRELKSIMRESGVPDSIWITEFGAYNCFLPHCSEQKQPTWIVKAYVLGLSEGVDKMIYQSAWSWKPAEENIWEGGNSLVRRDKTPRPSYFAYGIMTRQLHKAEYVGLLDGLPNGCVAHVFRRGENAVIVAWVKDKSQYAPWCKKIVRIEPRKAIDVKIPSLSEGTITDLYGNRVSSPSLGGTIEVTLDRPPVYINLPFDGLKIK